MHKETHIYLAAPYRGTQEQIEERMKLVAKVSGLIRLEGFYVTSPLFHHWAFQENDNWDGEYWLNYSENLLEALALSRGLGTEVEMWILCLEAWDESSGVRRERDIARKYGINVRYLHPQKAEAGELFDMNDSKWIFGVE
jgi:hypothetical protein